MTHPTPRSATRRDAGGRARLGARVCLAAGLGMAAGGLLGCGSAAARRDQTPIVLTIGVSGTPASIRTIAGRLTSEGLIRSRPDGRHEVALAAGWTIDGTSVTLQLQPNVTFHDGRPLTAAIIADHLEAARQDERELAQHPLLRDIERVEISGPHEIVLRLRQPSALILDDLTTPIAEDMANGGRLGTGPYQVDEITPELTRLRANATYRGGRPQIDVVEVRNYPTNRSAWAAMMRGEVDFLVEVPSETREFVDAETRVELFRVDETYNYALILNPETAGLADPGVRVALNYAVDRQAVIDGALRGYGVPASGLSPRHWMFGGVDRVYRFDPGVADRLLTERGYPPVPREATAGNTMPSRFRFRCVVPDSDPFEHMALQVQKQLYDLGVDMVIEPVSRAEFGDRLARGEYEAALAQMSNGEALARLYTYWGGMDRDSPSVSYLGANYAAIADVLRRLRAELDPGEQRRLAAELQRVFYDDPPAIFIANRQDARAVSRRFTPADDDGDILETVWRWQLTDRLETP